MVHIRLCIINYSSPSEDLLRLYRLVLQHCLISANYNGIICSTNTVRSNSVNPSKLYFLNKALWESSGTKIFYYFQYVNKTD